MTEKLKPCPFCGSDRTTIWNAGGGQQAVCKDCRATGPVFTCEEAWHQAFTAWNIRSGSEDLDRLKGALSSILSLKSFGADADALGELIVDIRSFARLALAPVDEASA